MSNSLQRSNAAFDIEIPRGFSKTDGRDLLRRQNVEIARGIVAATRVQSAAMVAAVGIQAVGMLSREAAFLAGGDAVTAARLEHIVDQLAVYAGSEVAQFRFNR